MSKTTLELIQEHAFIVGPHYKLGLYGPGEKQPIIGWAVYAEWVRVADDVYSESSDDGALAVGPTLDEAVKRAVEALQ